MKIWHKHIKEYLNDIVWFIDNVILAGVDPKMQQRDMFYNEYLMPPVNRTTAENIYYDLVESLFK